MDQLARLAKVQVHQKAELLEAVAGIETNNTYDVKDATGRTFLMALEETGFCARLCLGKQRPFIVRINDSIGKEVIRVTRDYKCNCMGQCFSCCNCCKDTVTVESPPGNVVGIVKQMYSMCSVQFEILDPNMDRQLQLLGPCYCGCRCPGQRYKFKLLSSDGSQEVGKLYKEWSGLLKEALTDADNFACEFPPDMAVETKATILGAVFLIDFMFFEDNSKKVTNVTNAPV